MYYLTFTEEFIMSEGYSGWIAGRMEVYDFDQNPSYAIYEKRFFTPYRKRFLQFRWAYEGQHVTDLILKQVERKLEEFNQGPDYKP